MGELAVTTYESRNATFRIAHHVVEALAIERRSIASQELASIWQPALASSLGVYRLTLRFTSDMSLSVQTFVVKVVDASGGGRHEADLYASGVLEHLRPPMTSAMCSAVVSLDPKSIAIVLEDLRDQYDGDWPISQYLRVSHLLGRFSAMPSSFIHAAARTVVPRDLLARDAVFASAVASISALGRNPTVAARFPRETIERLIWLGTTYRHAWQQNHSDPLMVCHGDVQRRNLVVLDPERVAFLDWANLAMAPPGIDVATLIYYAIAWDDLEVEDLGSFCSAMVASYVDGLREGKWFGKERQVEQSIYGQLIVGLSVLEAANTMRMMTNPTYAADTASRIGRPIEVLIAHRRWLTAELLQLSKDVLSLPTAP